MQTTSRMPFSSVDYGTNSVRALVVDVADGAEIGTCVWNYARGEAGVLLDPKEPNWPGRTRPTTSRVFGTQCAGRLRRPAPGRFPPRARGGHRHRHDRLDAHSRRPPRRAAGTGSQVPNLAHAWLWKDHTGHAEAAEITRKAGKHRDRYLAACGGTYSSEWYWSKILHCKRTAPAVFAAAHTWVELSDFVPAYITGTTQPEKPHARDLPQADTRRCTPRPGAACRPAVFWPRWTRTWPCCVIAMRPAPRRPKRRSASWPRSRPRSACQPGIPVAVGAFDAHLGAVGCGIAPGTLVKIIGTSTCDIAICANMHKQLADIPGLCGIVDGSVLPGFFGLEAGQSAVGDIFNWLVDYLQAGAAKNRRPADLTAAATKLRPGRNRPARPGLEQRQSHHPGGPAADRLAHRPDALHPPAEIYRALIEATAFGALTIINRFEEYGVKISEVVNCGGIAEKNPLVMQIYADCAGRPMKISRSAKTCALGAAIFGAVAGGVYRTTAQAQRRMTGVKPTVYPPTPGPPRPTPNSTASIARCTTPSASRRARLRSGTL